MFIVQSPSRWSVNKPPFRVMSAEWLAWIIANELSESFLYLEFCE